MRQKLTSAEIAKRRREGRYHDGRQPLTAKKVAKLKREGRYKDGLMPGLYLQVSKTGTKSWLLRYELNGSPERWMGLGPAVAFTLSEARQRARIARQQLADGVDPLRQKRAQRAAQAAAALKTVTFKEAAAAYLEAHQAKWRSAKHGQQWISSLQRFAYPIIGAIDVAAVDVPAVLRVLEQKVPASLGNPAGALWTARSVTADRVRNRIELILSWAAGRGHRSGDNPAAWGRLKHILPAPAKVARVVHHAAVPLCRSAGAHGRTAPPRRRRFQSPCVSDLDLGTGRRSARRDLGRDRLRHGDVDCPGGANEKWPRAQGAVEPCRNRAAALALSRGR
jgi:hypothetical protein